MPASSSRLLLSGLLSSFDPSPRPWYSETTVPRVNIVKHVKTDGHWIIRAIPRKQSDTSSSWRSSFAATAGRASRASYSCRKRYRHCQWSTRKRTSPSSSTLVWLGSRSVFDLPLTGMREQEVQHLFWADINFRLRTIRVTAKYGFYPKRWEEREIPVPTKLVEFLEQHPKFPASPFVFPSPTGNREQHMLDHCKEVAKRAGLAEKRFDLKTFRSTYATRMLHAGFDVRTVQQWMGHKSLETTMRYLVPASDVRVHVIADRRRAGTQPAACRIRAHLTT